MPVEKRITPESENKYQVDQLFYFGKFNPITKGHLYAIEQALSQIEAKNGLVLVVTNKDVWNRSLESYAHRKKMVQLALAENPELANQVRISDIELNLDLPGYTVDTLNSYKKALAPNSKIGLLVGGDVLSDLPKWKDIEKLLSIANVFVLPRGGSSEAEDLLSKVPEELESEVGSRLFLLELEDRRSESEYSSSDARSSELQFEQMVPQSVGSYRKKHGLYQRS